MKKLDYIFDAVFSLLIISLFLSNALPNLFVSLLVIFFLIKIKKNKNWSYLFSSSLLLSFYFLISSLINNNFIVDQSIVLKLLFIPLLILLTLEINNKIQIKISFVFIVLITNVFSIFKIISHYYHFGAFTFGNSEIVNQILIIDRPYVGFANVISFIFTLELMKIAKRKWFFKLIILFIILFLIIIVARLSLLTILVFVIIISLMKKPNYKTLVIYSILISSLLIIIFKFNNSVSERFYLKSTFKKSYNHFLFQEPRVVIWSCAYQLVQNKNFNILFGSDGFKKNQKNLTNCYNNSITNESKKDYYILKKFNTHNQFLDFFLSGGIIGLLLFINLLIGAYFYSNKSLESKALLFSLVLFLFVENLVWRQWGIYFLAILLALINDNKKLINE